MQCPIDGETLKMSERAGVEIDYCPKCRGVWLDRGELDKIIDRVEADILAGQDAVQAYPPAMHEDHYDDRGSKDRYEGRSYYKRKKRKSLLSELFDAFD